MPLGSAPCLILQPCLVKDVLLSPYWTVVSRVCVCTCLRLRLPAAGSRLDLPGFSPVSLAVSSPSTSLSNCDFSSSPLLLAHLSPVMSSDITTPVSLVITHYSLPITHYPLLIKILYTTILNDKYQFWIWNGDHCFQFRIYPGLVGFLLGENSPQLFNAYHEFILVETTFQLANLADIFRHCCKTAFSLVWLVGYMVWFFFILHSLAGKAGVFNGFR